MRVISRRPVSSSVVVGGPALRRSLWTRPASVSVAARRPPMKNHVHPALPLPLLPLPLPLPLAMDPWRSRAASTQAREDGGSEAVLPLESRPTRIKVVFGSQTGTAMLFSRQLVQELQQHGFAAGLVDAEENRAEQLSPASSVEFFFY